MESTVVVLRKSHGAFSAGTRVTPIDRDSRHKVNLCLVRGKEIHVHDDDLVTLRKATYNESRPPRWFRRRNAKNRNITET